MSSPGTSPAPMSNSRVFVRLLVLVVGCLVFVGAFAVASHPERSKGDQESSPGAISLVRDGLLALGLTLMLISLVFLVYVFWPRKGGEPIERPLREPSNLPWWLQVIMGLLPVLFTLGLMYWLLTHRSTDLQQMLSNLGAPADTSSQTANRAQGRDRAVSDYWLAITSGLALFALVAVGIVLFTRRRTETSDVTLVEAEEIASLTLHQELRAETEIQLDELANATDPRAAVIAAWAALEQILARHGFSRRASETAAELAARVTKDAQVPPAAMAALSRLYELARFSRHTIDTDMQREAVSTLIAIRDAL